MSLMPARVQSKTRPPESILATFVQPDYEGTAMDNHSQPLSTPSLLVHYSDKREALVAANPTAGVLR